MSIYNLVTAEMRCPRCGAQAVQRIEAWVGKRDLIEYRLGHEIAWVPRKAVENGGRPEGGDLDAEGYSECPSCGKDFFVVVQVRQDILVAVVPDMTKKGHIP